MSSWQSRGATWTSDWSLLLAISRPCTVIILVPRAAIRGSQPSLAWCASASQGVRPGLDFRQDHLRGSQREDSSLCLAAIFCSRYFNKKIKKEWDAKLWVICDCIQPTVANDSILPWMGSLVKIQCPGKWESPSTSNVFKVGSVQPKPNKENLTV